MGWHLQEGSKYFVVCEVARDDGDAFPGALGVPIRQGDRVDWLQPESVHALVREALWWRQHGPAVAATSGPAAGQQEADSRIRERCEAIERRAGWQETPFIALHAAPNPPQPRRDDFYADDGLKGFIENPPILRLNGFNLLTRSPADVQPDGSILSATNRRVLWLSQDGLLSAAARADHESFAWGFNRPGEAPIALNPKVAAEYFLEFCRFLHDVLKPRLQAPTWDVCLSLVGLDRRGGVVLAPELAHAGPYEPFLPGLHRSFEALRARTDVRLQSGATSGSDAHRLMAELYAAFGIPPRDFAYAVGDEISAAAVGLRNQGDTAP